MTGGMSWWDISITVHASDEEAAEMFERVCDAVCPHEQGEECSNEWTASLKPSTEIE